MGAMDLLPLFRNVGVNQEVKGSARPILQFLRREVCSLAPVWDFSRISC